MSAQENLAGINAMTADFMLGQYRVTDEARTVYDIPPQASLSEAIEMVCERRGRRTAYFEPVDGSVLFDDTWVPFAETTP